MHALLTTNRSVRLKFVASARALLALVSRTLLARRNRLRLEKLPDHMLKDVGISRSEILWVTRYRPTDGSARERL